MNKEWEDNYKANRDLNQAKIDIASLQSRMNKYERVLKAFPGKVDVYGETKLHGIARAYKSKTLTFNYSEITGQGKPTLVSQGVFYGFSLPVYNSDNEELFGCRCMDGDWDGTTDPIIYLGGWLTDANNAKKFNLQISVEVADFDGNAEVPATSNDYTTETTTGNWNAKTSFKAAFTIDASAIGLVVGYPLAIRVQRIVATADEIAGEVVIEGALLYYLADKFGTAS